MHQDGLISESETTSASNWKVIRYGEAGRRGVRLENALSLWILGSERGNYFGTIFVSLQNNF